MSFIKRVSIIVLILCVSAGAVASERADDDAHLKALVKKSEQNAAKIKAENPQLIKLTKESLAHAKDKKLTENLDLDMAQSETHRKAAYQLLNNIDIDAPMAQAQQSPVEPKAQQIESAVLVFASFSLGKDSLKAMAAAVSRYPNAAIIFRGIVNEDDYLDSVEQMQGISQNSKIIPNIALDPNLFKQYRITHVPTMVYRDIGSGEEIARVSGLHNPQYLIDKVAAGKKGDLGVKADIAKIKERDFIEMLKERMAAIDWQAQKEGAIRRFWHKQSFLHKPAATQTRIRSIDPTVEMRQDITDAYGRIIQPKGARINPLEHVSFDKALVIFNPNDERQLQVVDQELIGLKAKYRDITFIVTELERDKAWEQLQALADHFNAPVYKLMADINQRFMIENVPSIVTADRKLFYVKELEVKKTPKSQHEQK